MDREQHDVADAELAVLEVLWDQAPATVRQLTDALSPWGGGAHCATGQKLRGRREAKGFVNRDRGGWAHVFEARIDRDALILRKLQATADRLCGGSLTPLLTNLVRAR